MIERCNGRISKALATRRCRSGERYVDVYNHHLPPRVLGQVCPVEALAQWQLKQLELFVSRVNNFTGLDI